MGWTIFAVWIMCGIFFNIFRLANEDAPKGSTEKKVTNVLMWIPIVILGTMVIAFILYGIGWIWYHICGGGLFFETDVFGFWDGLLFGVTTVAFLGFILGFIATLSGWKPFE